MKLRNIILACSIIVPLFICGCDESEKHPTKQQVTDWLPTYGVMKEDLGNGWYIIEIEDMRILFHRATHHPTMAEYGYGFESMTIIERNISGG